MIPSLCGITLLLATMWGRAVSQQSGPVPARQATSGQSASGPVSEDSSGPVSRMTGRVVDDSGRPIAGATLLVTPAGFMSGRPATSLQPAVSDPEGRFQIKSLAPGAYTIGAEVEGYVTLDDVEAGYHRPGDSVTITLARGGVITGKVTDAEGEPLVGLRVRAIRVADEGRQAGASGFLGLLRLMSAMGEQWETDDRGIYRIYGLQSGSYLVSAGGEGPLWDVGGRGAYSGDAPTYYQSGGADTATQVAVERGQEVGGIDIAYRGGSGHSISGSIIGAPRPQTSIILSGASTGAMEGLSEPDSSTHSFRFDRIPDGEYDVGGMAESANEVAVSTPRRVRVRGADVTGLEISLKPLGSLAGEVIMERVSQAVPRSDCKSMHRGMVEETVIRPLRVDEGKSTNDAGSSYAFIVLSQASQPDAKGSFQLKYLAEGRHHLDVDLPGDDWYVRAVTRVGGPNGRPVDVGPDGLAIKTGERVTGVTITISEGAAGLRGRVVAEMKPPSGSRLRVFLIPASKERADDVLRYGEANVESDGSFVLKNLAPGTYWLVARAMPDSEFKNGTPSPAAWDKARRAVLRAEGESLNAPIELKPCGRVNDYTLHYKAAAAAGKSTS